MPTRTTTAVTAALLAAFAIGMTACSTDTAPEPSTDAAAAGSAISDERCEANKDAGKISFLTGYFYQASASILNTIAADELGYFDALCLDVEIKPGTGDTGENAQLLASGQVTFTGVGEQNLIQAQDNGIDILGISTLSNVGLEILMTNTDVKDLADLDGTILGQKGNMPPAVEAMLTNAGADVSSIQQVVVGYDPTILPRGQVDSLTGFISNEPNLLEAQDFDVTVWRPFDYGVPSSLGSVAVNPAFAEANPTAVEDFMRASLHAIEYCDDNTEECVEFASVLSGEGYDVAHNVKIWDTESGIIAENQPADRPIGLVDTANVDAISEFLVDTDQISEAPADVQSYFDNSFVENIYDGTTLIWPAP
ncbi:NitT/TauT family transport system substrate-binding protein [Conyzicola lurida]|uniref:NitT/TauT family transport system substrate-binding protein n=1 Tax=Conyzicola lurida TaxID=1172621 RepID=A0A841AJU9_9MICO|nr:ABC transporter substrate-binding protein [Conyzicola lurida]MBB5843487.1 NitT/TauT family transport system substrate-binding protein [Conyzicola lurida]